MLSLLPASVVLWLVLEALLKALNDLLYLPFFSCIEAILQRHWAALQWLLLRIIRIVACTSRKLSITKLTNNAIVVFLNYFQCTKLMPTGKIEIEMTYKTQLLVQGDLCINVCSIDSEWEDNSITLNQIVQNQNMS